MFGVLLSVCSGNDGIAIDLVRTAESAQEPDMETGNELNGTRWVLVALDGQEVDPGSGAKQINLHFGASDQSVSGFAGCNRFGGSFEQSGDSLSLGRMMSTMMACAEGMDREQRILQALEQVRRYSLDGDELNLLGADGKPLLRYRTG
jgi:putative lipoprotein